MQNEIDRNRTKSHIRVYDNSRQLIGSVDTELDPDKVVEKLLPNIDYQSVSRNGFFDCEMGQGADEIHSYNTPNTQCSHQTCSNMASHYIGIKAHGVPLFIPLCSIHATQYEFNSETHTREMFSIPNYNTGNLSVEIIDDSIIYDVDYPFMAWFSPNSLDVERTTFFVGEFNEEETTISFKCPMCGRTHTHGAISGSRLSHCRCDEVEPMGYFIITPTDLEKLVNDERVDIEWLLMTDEIPASISTILNNGGQIYD